MNHSSFSSLVDELLLAIIEQIDSKQALCSFAATCSRLRNLTEPFIWKSLLVLHGRQASRVAHALYNYPNRLSKIQTLGIHYKHNVADGIEELDSLISHMSKLRHLTIESPCPNNGEWRNETEFTAETKINYGKLFEESVQLSIPTRPLQMLRSLILHGHGRGHDMFRFGRAVSIFLHPTITDITISCTNFEADSSILNAMYIPATAQKSTALRSLRFVESNVYLELLDFVLSLPKALKELYIGERLFSWEGCYPDPNKQITSHVLLLDVLQRQAKSLERLSHTGGRFTQTRNSDEPDGARLRNLTSLQHLKVDSGSILLDFLAADGCPDRLKTLKIVDEVKAVLPINSILPPSLNFYTFLKQIYVLVTKIPATINIEACFSHHSRGADILADLAQLWDSQSGRTIVYNISRLLKARNARLHIFAERFPGGTAFIEPYMHDEERPVEDLVYSSDDIWSFLGNDYQSRDDESMGAERIPLPHTEDFDTMSEDPVLNALVENIAAILEQN